MDARIREAERLRRDVEWALRRALDPADVLPMLHRLAQTAEDGTEASIFAHRHLAELIVERDPWRAALHARRVIAKDTADDRGWAMLGLCHTLLGHYRCAAASYRHALEAAPKNPWYAHNLGHLLDVALDRPDEAVLWLGSAYAAINQNGEIAASYAHALARSGKIDDARTVLVKARRALKRDASREHDALLHWLEQGAPNGPGPLVSSRKASRLPKREAAARTRPRVSAKDREETAMQLSTVLSRGLSSLPLDSAQRARARELARDVVARGALLMARPTKKPSDLQSLAAAIAYAIVYVDHVPLTPAEVAACFRVSVSSARGRFAELRAELALTPGDARYATTR